jgi:uncharacterized membrane protein
VNAQYCNFDVRPACGGLHPRSHALIIGRAMDVRRESDVLLDAVLRPNPPLTPGALLAILAIVATVNLAFSISFVLRGAWPIAPFMGLDVALLAWAFRRSRIAAAREEHVRLTGSLLRVLRKPAPRGAAEVTFNPYWVHLEMDDPPGHGSQLTLWSHGKGLRIGTFLAPAERAAFAERLRVALCRAKGFAG